MTVESPSHPTAELLAAYRLGQLNESDMASVAAHLESCPACCQEARSIPASVLNRVRAATPSDATALTPETLPNTPPGAGNPGPTEAVVLDLPPELAEHPSFRILQELGRGGMGVVYKAEQRIMETPVALKVINPKLLNDDEALKRFDREVRAAARLVHPNIVRALHAERAGELRLLVMEFVEGASLSEVLKKRKGPLPIADACGYVRQAALGFQHAYEKGMVHRDVKPANLMLTHDGVIKILDFGLARLASEQNRSLTELTHQGDFMGTPDYVAPEQALDASKADIRADLYSLGCTLYHLLAGRPPFREESAVKQVLAHVEKKPTPLPQVRPDVPPELWAVVARLLAKEPADRYQKPIELAEALAPFCKTGKQSDWASVTTRMEGEAGRSPKQRSAASTVVPTESALRRTHREPLPSQHCFHMALSILADMRPTLREHAPLVGTDDSTLTELPKGLGHKPARPARKMLGIVLGLIAAGLLAGLLAAWVMGGFEKAPDNTRIPQEVELPD